MKKLSYLIIFLFLFVVAKNADAQNYYSLSFTGSSYVNIDAAAWRNAGYAVDYNGTNAYAKSNSVISLSGSAITLEAWVYVNSFAAGANDISSIIGIENGSGTALLRFGDPATPTVANNKLQFVLYFGSAQVKLNDTTALSTNTWYHVAGTYDGTNMRIYINGIETVSAAQTGNFTANDYFYIGAMNSTPTRFINGKIDEIRVWTGARAAYEIERAAYNQLAVNDSISLQAYYQMSDGIGTSITDNGTHSHDLTLTNGIWVSSTAPLGRIRNFTMECWVNITTNSEKGCFLHLGPNDWGYGIGVGASGNNSYDTPGNQLIMLSDITRWIPTGANIGTGWHHIAMVVDNESDFIAYLDGLEVYTETNTNWIPWGLTASPIATIGGMPTTRNFTGGDIDEVRFWKEARTQQQIRDDLHFQAIGNETNLLAYYKMTDGSGTTLTDNSTNTYNGTITSGVWVDSLSSNNMVYGQGTSSDKYLIANLNNLSWFTQSTGKFSSSFKQTANIDALNTQYWDDSDDNSDGDKYNDPNDLTATGTNDGFYPIGMNSDFTGNYDGDNNLISNIKISRGSSDQIGLFGVVANGTVNNLGLTNTNITGNLYVGGLEGRGWQETVTNCYSNGTVSGYQYVGGLIGYLNGNSLGDNNITNCYSMGTCASSVVYNYGFTGGLIGSILYSIVNNCYTSADVTYSDGNIQGRNAAFAGFCNYSTVSNSYATGNVYYSPGTDPSDRGFVGYTNATTYSSNFWDYNVSNQTTATGATAKTTSQMTLSTTFLNAGWSFVKSNGHWAMNGSDNSGYPFLRFESYTPSQIWLGTNSSAWATSGNWSEEVAPISTQNIIVPNIIIVPVVSGASTKTVNNMLIENGASFVLAVDGWLTISGNLTNNGIFTVNSDATGTGSLIVNGTATGNVTVERFLTHDRWHYISEQTNISGNFITLSMGLTGGANSDQFYRWDESLDWGGNIGNWVDILNGPAGNNSTMSTEGFTSCKGYAINYITTDKTLSLSGVPYVADKTIALSKTTNSTASGTNLIGNPFTSTFAINKNADGSNYFLQDNFNTEVPIIDLNYIAIYLWNESSGWDGSSDADYLPINNSSAATFVQPGQAFMVVAANDGVNLNFKKATRKHGSASFYKSANDNAGINMKLFVKDAENRGNSTAIAFLPEMTFGLDPGYDAGKLKGNTKIALYTRLVEDNGVDFGIQALPDDNIESIVVPVGLDVAESIMCEFSVKPNALKDYSIYLEDKQENTVTNLKESNYSTLVSESGVGRFFLHFAEISAINEPATQSPPIKVWAYKSTINIFNNDNLSGEVKVHNMFGQAVVITKLNGDSNQQLEMTSPSGYYIVNIVTNKGVVNRKVYLR